MDIRSFHWNPSRIFVTLVDYYLKLIILLDWRYLIVASFRIANTQFVVCFIQIQNAIRTKLIIEMDDSINGMQSTNGILNGCQFFNSILRYFWRGCKHEIASKLQLCAQCFKLIISKSINFKSITNSSRSSTAEWHFTFDICGFLLFMAMVFQFLVLYAVCSVWF